MSFGTALRKLAMVAAGHQPPDFSSKFVTPRVVHRAAYQMGIPSQNNPAFDHFARHVTGQTDLRKMNQWQLHTLLHEMHHLQGAYSTMAPP
jgi:hypothetical protein